MVGAGYEFAHGDDYQRTAHYIKDNRHVPVARVLSNSFGFGGTNCSLIFGRAA